MGKGNSLTWGQTPGSFPASYQYTESPPLLIPRIRTQPKTFRIAEGQGVDLPCIVDNIGKKIFELYHKGAIVTIIIQIPTPISSLTGL